MARARVSARQPSVKEVASAAAAIVESVSAVIQGKADAIGQAIVCMLAGGHLLIEDVPGVGKTMLAKALARSTSCSATRIQFTPDLLPSDVVGVNIYNRTGAKFEFVPGAVFANLVLGDEINRATPKTQSALLEAMEERQVTVDKITHRLPDPFMVIATQNPLEHEGIYPLPQSQVDRFTMRIHVGYPSASDETTMLEMHGAYSPLEDVVPVISVPELLRLIALVRKVFVAPAIRKYIVDIVTASRTSPELALGASPRAALYLIRVARARAAMQGREYVLPDDVKLLALPVLAHRVVLSPDAEMRNASRDEIVRGILGAVAAPPATAAPARA